MGLLMFLSKHSNGTYYLFYFDEQGKRKRVSTHWQYKTDALRFLQSFKKDEYKRRQKTKRKLLSDFLSYAEGSFSKRTVVGHADIKTTMIYAKVQRPVLENTIRTLELSL
jgi:hypothetical protein